MSALEKLLLVWPRFGAVTHQKAKALRRQASALGIVIDPQVTRRQLQRVAARQAHRIAAIRSGTTLWSMQRFLQPGPQMRNQAVKIQPGAMVPVAFNGVQANMYVDTARRLRGYRGKATFLEMHVKLDTENLPIILTNESKCACLYCGTEPRGDEHACRSCGAPLAC